MNTTHASYANDYLINTQWVIDAGRRLRDRIDADRATLEYATQRLERAVQQHETGGTGYRSFMFSELDATTESDKATRERITEDTLASVLTDLQVANLLVAAGLTLGEAGKKAEPRLLDEALLSLGDTASAMERSMAASPLKGARSGRFGFTEEVAIPEAIESDNLPCAIEAFRSRSDEVLTTLVKEAQGVVTSVFTALKKVDAGEVANALSNLGSHVKPLKEVGRLFCRGVKKLESAISALIRLLGSERLVQLKARIEEVWEKLKAGEYIDQVLSWAFRVEDTRTHISDILDSEGLNREKVDDATNSLAALTITFGEKMAMAKSIATVISFVGPVLALTPLAGPNLALLIASAYVLILAAVVLIGMDYTDSGFLLRRVRGVREIAQSLVG